MTAAPTGLGREIRTADGWYPMGAIDVEPGSYPVSAEAEPAVP